MPLVVVGDALLDRDIDGQSHRLCPDAPAPVIDDPVERARPGGAALAAALAAAGGTPVTLVTALGADDAGRTLAAVLAEHGVDVIDLGLDGPTPEKVRVRAGSQTLARIDRGGRAAGRPRPLTAAARAAMAGAGAVLVSDYGRGLAAAEDVRAVLADLGRTPVVWDPHPRGPAPVPGVLLVTPSEAEAGTRDAPLAVTAARARELVGVWSVRSVCITRGRRGALLVEGDGLPLAVPAPAVTGGDPCGAGDRFASAAACALAAGAVVSEAVTDGVAAASAFVAAGGAASVRASTAAGTAAPSPAAPRARTPEAVIEAVRARGGTVVATGGCFDLLHAGHISLLAGARALGDCLVVCLNSDRSVRRLKGSGRPVVAEHDRARVLGALATVDAVAVFDEDTPVATLERLRPDVFVKGGDYGGRDIPEAEALARWGGAVVVLPYIEGRSTTRLLEEMARHARP